MIKILEKTSNQNLLYTCIEGDTLESIANKFNITTADILRDNPLFSSVYAGCMLYLTGIGKKKIIVAPLQTLEMIANEHNISVQRIMELNELKSPRVFVGMQLLID